MISWKKTWTQLEIFYGWCILYLGIDYRIRRVLFYALLIEFSVTLDALCEIINQRVRPIESYVHFSTIYPPFSAEKSHRLRFLSQEKVAKNGRWVVCPLIKGGAKIGQPPPPFLLLPGVIRLYDDAFLFLAISRSIRGFCKVHFSQWLSAEKRFYRLRHAIRG